MRNVAKISISPILISILVSALGCAGVQSGERGLLVSGAPYELPEPGTRFERVEEAAVAALTHVRRTSSRSETEQLHVGSIVRIEGGYTWQEADQSGNHLNPTWRPTARVQLSSDHVATYVVHPRIGDRRTDRANEKITRGERELVDEVDPLHRPMFLLTPSGRIVSYNHGAPAVEIADLRRGRIERNTSASSSARASRAVESSIGLAERVE
jgi:hypothetical protein